MANQTARFFRDGTTDFVEIRTMGDPCSYVGKVTPETTQQFPREWAAYEAGNENVDYGGRDLTEIPGFTPQLRLAYKLKGVHNLEMLASASDAAVSALGMGALAARKMAQLLLKEDAPKEDPPAEKRGPGRPRKTQEADA